MSEFRKLAHLKEQIGRRGFSAFLDSRNLRRVKDFVSGLVTPLPAQMTIGGRTYEIVGFEGDELDVACRVIVEQADTKDAHLDEEDGRYILDEGRQEGIPATLREVNLVCAGWHASHSRIACLIWLGDHWGVSFGHVNRTWNGPLRLLRRKAEQPAEPELPTEMIIGGRTYEVVSFLRDSEDSVGGTRMVFRAREEQATIGQKDGEFILANQSDIPTEFDEIDFVCADWLGSFQDSGTPIACLSRQDNGESESRWRLRWRLFRDLWGKRYRLLRRKDRDENAE